MWHPRSMKNLVSHLQRSSKKLSKRWHYVLGMIKKCFWKGMRLNCSSVFTMHPSDRGMCCSFNKEKADEMFKQNRYRENMEFLRDQDKRLSREKSDIPPWWVQGFTKLLLSILFCNAELLIQVWLNTRIRRNKGSATNSRCPQWSCYIIFSHRGL